MAKKKSERMCTKTFFLNDKCTENFCFLCTSPYCEPFSGALAKLYNPESPAKPLPFLGGLGSEHQ